MLEAEFLVDDFCFLEVIYLIRSYHFYPSLLIKDIKLALFFLLGVGEKNQLIDKVLTTIPDAHVHVI